MADSPGLYRLKQIFSRSLTIDHTQVPSTQTDFPVLVRIQDYTFRHASHGGHVNNLSGFDIGFYSDASGTTKLKWEMERYNAGTGEIVAWVKISSVSSASDTTFYMFYGDPAIVTDQSDAVNTFSNSFISVYHLKNGTIIDVSDALGSNNGTNHGVSAVAGQIDGGGGFVSASSQYVDLGTAIHPVSITLSAWVNGASFPNAYNAVIDRSDGVANYWAILVKSNGKLGWFAARNSSSRVDLDGTGSHTLSAGTDYYLAMTYTNSGTLIGYVNGAQDNTGSTTAFDLTSTALSAYIGNDPAVAGRFWNGLIDEGRIASAVRSPDWITIEYNNQKPGSTFLTVGSET